jgi:ElaB/YqjD/DUF883 family membrane-anchored ribosome-binding protein
MATATVQKPEDLERAIRDRVADLQLHAAQLSQEVREFRSKAEDTVDDALRSARRSVRRGIEGARDVRDDAVSRIKRQPLGAVGVSLGVGAIVGLMAGLMLGRCSRTD